MLQIIAMTKSEKEKNVHIVNFAFSHFIDSPFEKKHKSHHLVNGYLVFLTEFLRRVMCSIRHEPKNFLLIYFWCRLHDILLMRSKQFLLSSSKFTFVSACPTLIPWVVFFPFKQLTCTYRVNSHSERMECDLVPIKW